MKDVSITTKYVKTIDVNAVVHGELAKEMKKLVQMYINEQAKTKDDIVKSEVVALYELKIVAKVEDSYKNGAYHSYTTQIPVKVVEE